MLLYNSQGALVANTLEDRDFYCTLALYPRIGVCGDSYANGNNGENEEATNDTGHPIMSWPQIIARRNGITVANYSVGGQSTRSFITNNTYGLPKLITDPQCDVYILALERNDYNHGRSHSGYLGSLTDITGYSLGSYPDTYYGNYATIIDTIKQTFPTARIVMMTGDYVARHEANAYNIAVEEIAEHYQIPCMVQMNDEYFAESNTFYRSKTAAGHPAPAAYAGMAMAIERMFNKCVKENRAYFDYYHSVATM